MSTCQTAPPTRGDVTTANERGPLTGGRIPATRTRMPAERDPATADAHEVPDALAAPGTEAASRRCRTIADSVRLTRPFTPAALVRSVGRQLGCVIDLAPLPTPLASGVSGIVVDTAAGYVIGEPADADEWWVRACVCHELAHILCGHPGGPGDLAGGAEDAGCPPQTPFTAITAWLPDLRDAAEAWGPLFRCRGRGVAEQEAELVGALLLHRIDAALAGPSVQRRPEVAGPGADQHDTPRADIHKNSYDGSYRDRHVTTEEARCRPEEQG